MLSLLITFSSFTYSYDEDLAKLNKVIKVSHSKKDSYKTSLAFYCNTGFIEGRVWGASETQYPYKECLNKTNLLKKDSYKTNLSKKCIEGFIEGRVWKSEVSEGFIVDGQFLRTNQYDYKECRRVKPLHD